MCGRCHRWLATLPLPTAGRFPCGLQIRHQSRKRLAALLGRGAQYGGGMYGRKHCPDSDRGRKLQHLTTLLGDPECRSEQRPSRCRAQANDQGRVDQSQLSFEPGQTCLDVGDLRCGVNAPFPRSVKRKCLTAFVT